MAEVDRVLIAGAGPVGLVAALSLARRGIPVTVFEALGDRALDLRASTIHPPTCEMLGALGLIDKIMANGVTSPFWQYRDRNTGPVAIFDLGVLANETPYPYRVQCEQFKLTGFLLEALAAYPHARLHFHHRAVDATEDATGVTLRLDAESGPVEIRGRYLIAADGASSALRKAAGIAFEGYTYPERFLVVSTPFDFAATLPDLSLINYVSDPEEWFVLLRVKDMWRVLFPTEATDSEAVLLSDEAINRRLMRIVARERPYEIVHRSIYAVHQRVAVRYVAGRILLAGDAAHINNPLGGMGMNGGIHDAVNLVEKLAAVWDGEDPALLGRYERQRRTIALEDVQKATARNRELMRERDPAARERSLDELRRTAADPVRTKEMLLKSSMISGLQQAAAIA